MKVLKKGNVKQIYNGIEIVGWAFDAEGGAIDIDAMIDAAMKYRTQSETLAVVLQDGEP